VGRLCQRKLASAASDALVALRKWIRVLDARMPIPAGGDAADIGHIPPMFRWQHVVFCLQECSPELDGHLWVIESLAGVSVIFVLNLTTSFVIALLLAMRAVRHLGARPFSSAAAVRQASLDLPARILPSAGSRDRRLSDSSRGLEGVQRRGGKNVIAPDGASTAVLRSATMHVLESRCPRCFADLSLCSPLW
jgi:hypothetical protein